MKAYRPEAVVHLAFILDPLRTGVINRKHMWLVNVAGTSRVTEAIAEHNRMIGGIEKFIFPSSTAVYGPDLEKPVTEDAPLNAQSLPYALHQQEADMTVQARAKGLRKCKTYILRSHIYAGATVQNYQLGVLRGVPGGKAVLQSGFAARIPGCHCGCLRAAHIWKTNFNSFTLMMWRA